MSLSKLSNFYVRSGLFGILALIAAVFNYAIYPILVRILSARQFGDFAAIVALSNQVLGLLLAFNIISIYLVKTQSETAAREHAQIIQKALIWFFIAITGLLLISSPYLHHLLKVQNLSSFILLAVILVTAVPAIVWTGYLQGHKELVRIGIYNVSASFAKLVLATTLAVAFGTMGGIWGLLGGAVAGLLVIMLVPGVKLPRLRTVFQKSDAEQKRFLWGLKGYFVECIFVVGALSFLQNYDITLAKALFPPDAAGVYSGISILSNALYYVSFLLIWIILPEIHLGDDEGNRRVLGTAYKLLAGLAGMTIVGELILKNYLARLLLGAGFAGQGNLLIFASAYQLTLVAITLYAFYLLVNRSRRGGLLGLLVASGTLLIPARLAHTPLSMIRLLWLSLVGGFIVYWVATRFITSRKPAA